MRRRAGGILALGACLLGVPGCGVFAASRPAGLRVMTYNIHYGDPDLVRIAAVICESGADIVGLQEVDVHWDARSGFADQAAELARQCGMQFRYGPIYTLPAYEAGKPSRQFGVAVLSRFPIVASTNHPLPRLSTQSGSAGPEPMPGFLQATIRVGDALIEGFVTHLDFRPDPSVRAAQVAEMLTIMGEMSRATILMGDLNAPPERPELAPLFARMRDAWSTSDGPGYTYPADAPARRIDFVLVGGPVDVSSARVIHSDASDHRPVVAELTLRSR
jgi:endonuclease/exonuclease/phosphatase family metal-dependent hydrolase